MHKIKTSVIANLSDALKYGNVIFLYTANLKKRKIDDLKLTKIVIV